MLLPYLYEDSMSGSIDKTDILKIHHEIEVVKTNVARNARKIDEIRDEVYNKDRGMYRRLDGVIDNANNNSELIKAIELKYTEKLDKLDKRISVIENINKDLVSIGGTGLQDIRDVVEKNKKRDKAYKLIAGSTVAVAAKIIYDIASYILNSI